MFLTCTYSFDDVMDQFLCFINFLLSVCHDQTMEIFLLVTGMSGIRATFSFLYGSFSSDGNLGLRFSLHLLESISTWSDE